MLAQFLNLGEKLLVSGAIRLAATYVKRGIISNTDDKLQADSRARSGCAE